MMVDTHGKPLSLEWIEYWFPKYIHDGIPIILKRGRPGTRVWGFRRSRETTPWRFRDTSPGTVSLWGYIKVGVDTIWPRRRYEKREATQEEYENFLHSMNYYRNGNKTMDGGPGLDPEELIGAWNRPGTKIYHCKNGTYTIARSAFRRFRKGTPAQFFWRDGPMWEGDHWS